MYTGAAQLSGFESQLDVVQITLYERCERVYK
jgi:hypothetical protein